jgi:glycine betaine/proline transport system substrate-binding protein
LSLAATGCGKSDKRSTGKSADLVYVNWAEGIAYTHLAKVILEDKMGYKVKLTAADVGPAYTSVAQGDKDAFMETWLPVLHKDYIDKYKDQVVDLGHVYQGTQSGLVVPAYVTIDKVSELNEARDKFGGQIIGIDYKLVQSSGPAMAAALKEAIDKKQWIVVTGWKPHWKFGRWDLKFLEQDADKMVWKEGNIHIMGRKNLEADKPELAQFLKTMKMTDEQLSDLMVKVNSGGDDVEAVARQWMNDNEAVVSAWIPQKS